MTERCKFKQGNFNCGSYAFSLYKEQIEQGDLCDVHYWQERAHRAEALAQPEQAPMHYYRADAEGNLERTDIHFAQPAQEPLEYWNAVEGWVKIDEVREHFASVGCGTIYKTAGEDRVPVYTTPSKRPWVDLPHEDILDLFDEHNVYGSKWIEFAHAVLAKSKEKNT